MADYPDVYADGFSISGGPFGITVTLLRSEPTGQPGAHEEPTVIVARVRLNPALAQAIATALSQTLANIPALSQQTVQGTTKH